MNSRFAVAIHTLTILALNQGQVVSSEMIAASVNTNPVVIRRMIGLLAAAGLVSVQAGRNGGATLTRDPSDISLLDVYRAVEERELIPLREGANPNCAVGRKLCSVLHRYTTGAEEALADYFRSETLGDVVRDMKRAMRE